MSTKTAEEAAREHGTLYYFDSEGNRKDGGLHPIKEQSFLAGVQWAQERERVMWLGYTIINKQGYRIDGGFDTIEDAQRSLDNYIAPNKKECRIVRIKLVEVEE